MRRAKIVCTIGPATHTREGIRALIDAGMDCARLNFSHGTQQGHARVAALVRELATEAGRPIALLADLCGPKIRVGRFPEGAVELVEGTAFTLTTRDVAGTDKQASINYAALPQDVDPGDAIMIDDGLIRLVVREVEGPDIHCIVEVGGMLSERKGINVPGSALSTPALTDKDKRDLAFAVDTIGVDWIALSFVRTAADILEAKSLAKNTPVIAKLEKPEAIANLCAIADVADGAMVARGDLGVELGPEKVPLVQKRIIEEVNTRGKLVITATQMLDSMIRNPRPTRAEAADIANAVLDGTDALMLSGETAVGRYPIKAVKMMDVIIREVETAWLKDASMKEQVIADKWGFATATTKAAALLSFVLDLKALVVFTQDGRTVQLLSEYRPRAPIIALTSDSRVANQLALEWGVYPRLEVPPEELSEAVRIGTGLVLRHGICAVGDDIALVLGWPVRESTNTLKLHRIG
uniref:Pyruvate kinase n=1 Tax=uncultured delta proteobacterium DeepAnt-32C6 TaxID=357895 RepID=Q2I6K6_9DELT|nr:pyruvate kinase [uncultured delta proteobacterium DeepAnt-32C6]